MLNKDVFKEQLQKMAYLYPSWRLDVTDGAAIKNWYEMFSDFEDDQFIRTVTKFCKTSKYVPTVAGLIECKAQVNHTAPWYKEGQKDEGYGQSN